MASKALANQKVAGRSRWNMAKQEEVSGGFTRIGGFVFSLIHFSSGWRQWVRATDGSDALFNPNGYASEAEARAAIAAVQS